MLITCERIELTTRERIEQLEFPRVREVLTNFVDEFESNLFIPNSLLPKNRQGKKISHNDCGESGGEKEYGKLYPDLAKIIERENEEKRVKQEIVKERIAMDLRLDAYVAQTETDGEYNENPIEFMEDEDRLYYKQLRFVNMLVRVCAIDADDLTED